MSSLFAFPQQRALDNSGRPLPGARLYFYENLTTTPKNVYADSALNTPHTNPVVADAFGVFQPIWLDTSDGNYTVKLTDSANVQQASADDIGASDVTLGRIIELLNPQNEIEQGVGVDPADKRYLPGEAARYSTLDDLVLVCEGLTYHGTLSGVVYTRTAPLVITDSINLSGVGTNLALDVGTILSSTSQDVEVVTISNATRSKISDLGIIHRAATKYAITAVDSHYLRLTDIAIGGGGSGFGGVFLGNINVIPNSDNYLSIVENLDIRSMASVGLTINSRGHTFAVRDCKIGDCPIDLEANSEHVNICGGQLSHTRFYNLGAGDIEGGSMEHVKIEGVDAGEYGVVIDGATNSFNEVLISDVGGNFNAIAGTLVYFGRAKWCKCIDPAILHPTDGGILCEWSANSLGCQLVCDYNAATAPVTVSASATRATKHVTGVIARSQVASITTNANLRTVLVDGVDELPQGFTPIHANGAWNYWLVTLADDAASSFALPTTNAANTKCRVRVLTDGAVTFCGEAYCNASSGGAAIEAPAIGADFEFATGGLTGTTGTDVKVTLSAHTDGKIYLENRSGASRDFTVLLEPVLFGT